MLLNSFHRISVFEHQFLKVGESYGEITFTETHRDALERFYGKGVPYFQLINKGVQFTEFVGVIQIGNLIIEVLPKADKYGQEDEWRRILIGMLKAVGIFNISAPTSSTLNLKSNYILDLYFELFIKEVEYLLHKGLIKKYRKSEGNNTSLKGAFDFGNHLQKNLVHQERFYVKYTTYDQQHLIHQILFKTLKLLQRINCNANLTSKIGALLLNFPEMQSLNVSDATFDKLVLNRKSSDYKNAIEIARLLLLNYHPDVSKGQNDVLALMFDMNLLWEQFIYVTLRKFGKTNLQVKAQASKQFWQPKGGRSSTIKPDIFIATNKVTEDNKQINFVLDTKWKNNEGKNPSPEDLRQLYVYHHYFEAEKVALLYPGSLNITPGHYYNIKDDSLSKMECSVINIPTNATIQMWQENIAKELIEKWMGIPIHEKETVL